MHIAGHLYRVLSTSEIETIHQNALRILSEMGMEIQNHILLQDLADFGLVVDFEQERVRFPADLVEGFIADVPKYDWDNHIPRVTATAGIYHGLYHDPVSGELLPWTEERLAFYFSLARELDHINGASMLGCRIPVPPLWSRSTNATTIGNLAVMKVARFISMRSALICMSFTRYEPTTKTNLSKMCSRQQYTWFLRSNWEAMKLIRCNISTSVACKSGLAICTLWVAMPQLLLLAR